MVVMCRRFLHNRDIRQTALEPIGKDRQMKQKYKLAADVRFICLGVGLLLLADAVGTMNLKEAAISAVFLGSAGIANHITKGVKK